MASTLTVVGGSIASLVAADAARGRGRRVDLLLPTSGVGGGFLGIQREGARLDLGFRALELEDEVTAASQPFALKDYVPAAGAWRHHVARIRELVEGLVGGALRAMAPPQMLVDGRLVDDVYLTVDLANVRDVFRPEDLRRVLDESRRAWRHHGEAGVLGAGGPDLSRMTFEEASLTNHGPTFHRLLVAPICDKIQPSGASGATAELRRRIWMPLFYPRTIAEACAGEEIAFRPHRPFYTVEPGGFAEVVERLLARLVDTEGVRVTRVGRLSGLRVGPRAAVTLDFADGTTCEATRPVIGVPAEELFAAVGGDYAPERVRMVLVWAAVAEECVSERMSVVHVTDPGVPALRVTRGGALPDGRRVLCVEMRHDVSDDEAPAAAGAALRAVGVDFAGESAAVLHHIAGPAFVAPTRENQDRLAAAQVKTADLPAEIVGGAAAFGADSFNEQVIQGLRAEEATS